MTALISTAELYAAALDDLVQAKEDGRGVAERMMLREQVVHARETFEVAAKGFRAVLVARTGPNRGVYGFASIDDALSAAGDHGYFTTDAREVGRASLAQGKPWIVSGTAGAFTVLPVAVPTGA